MVIYHIQSKDGFETVKTINKTISFIQNVSRRSLRVKRPRPTILEEKSEGPLNTQAGS